jgi:hypothetical protein
MLTGKPYHVAKKAIFGNEIAGLTHLAGLKTAMAELGRSPAKRMIPLRGRDYRALTNQALLKVNPRSNGEWHWVVWSGNRLLDPKVPPYQLSRLRPVSYLSVE